MASEIIPASYADVVFIARRMRALDAEEIYPLTWTGKAEDLAMGVAASGGIKHVALSSGVPVAAWGATMTRPHFWTVWMFATDRWAEVALTVTRHIRQVMMPAMIESGAVRADCWSMDGHDVAHRWLEVLGAVREASIEDYGATRKTFHCYSWTRTRLERDGDFDHVPRTVGAENAEGSGPSPAAPGSPDQGRSGHQCGGGCEKETCACGQGAEIHHLDRATG